MASLLAELVDVERRSAERVSLVIRGSVAMFISQDGRGINGSMSVLAVVFTGHIGGKGSSVQSTEASPPLLFKYANLTCSSVVPCANVKRENTYSFEGSRFRILQ